MKNSVLFALLCCVTLSFGQEPIVHFESRGSFFPEYAAIDEDPSLSWGFLTVPENWAHPGARQLKLAVAILKNTSGKSDAEAILMIEGGPGAGALEGMGYWLQHPLRSNHDIVLMDTRGTGFSEPRLCPDLGQSILQVLAKDQAAEQDELEKARLAMACKQDLIARGIDLKAYHSQAMAKDFHALRTQLKYPGWKVYAVSYGTHVAQVYAEKYPADVRALILDSPIADIGTYYNRNSSNYLSGLENMFKDCAESPDCHALYPNLKETYYRTIAALEKDPITVTVDKNVVPSGSFTYNADDFKIAIHQALYQKILVEVLPLLIQDFHDRNVHTLGALVSAFAGALRLDYGLYYCVSCTEAIPNNGLEQYRQDAEAHPGLSGGLSFYRSDFVVCDKWNQQEQLDSSQFQVPTLPAQIPTLVIAGEYDPITPLSNGEALRRQYPHVQLVEAATFGHAAGFSNNGRKIAEAFFNAPDQPVEDLFDRSTIQFATHVHKHEGLAAMGNSLNAGDFLFFVPLLIAFLISLGALFVYPVLVVRRRKTAKGASQGLRILLAVGSLLAVAILFGLGWGLTQTAAYNFYILAFGLLEQYAFVFQLLVPFMLVLALAFLLFFIRMNKVEDRSIYFSVLFSHALILVYLWYWGVL